MPPDCIQGNHSAIDVFLPGLPAVIVALLGLAVVHFLSVKRQRRDEYFKLVQSVREIVHKIGDDAATVWMKPGSDPSAQQAGLLFATRIARVGRIIAALKERQNAFELNAELAHFRRVATRDIEDPKRLPSNKMAQHAAEAASKFETELDLKFFEIFG